MQPERKPEAEKCLRGLQTAAPLSAFGIGDTIYPYHKLSLPAAASLGNYPLFVTK